MKKVQTKGIVIFAFGHINYYRMAENLAASLMANGARENKVHIALVCDKESRVVHPQLFNDIIRLPHDKFMEDGKVVFNNATIDIYNITPYDRSIKLDADTIWIKGRSIAKLFKWLEEVPFVLENTGHTAISEATREQSVWASAEQIISAYGLKGAERSYTIFGEFVYFRKCKEAKAFFAKAKKIYKEAKVECASFSNGKFTDELAFQIAAMQMGVELISPFTPVFNTFLRYKHLMDKYPYQLPENYFAYSIGGNSVPVWQKTQYNILADHSFNVLGLQNPFHVLDKRSYLPERIKL